MYETTPMVYLVGQPQVNYGEMERYLRDVDIEALQWLDRIKEDGSLDPGEILTEFGGRLCYKSWTEGLNPNVRRVRKDSKAYFRNILDSRHGSVLEHATYNFVFHNVSRVFTHELITHRVGTAKSQESLRYVRLANIGFRVPPVLEPMREKILSIVEQLEEFQIEAAQQLRLDDEGVPFHVKKEATSALRRLAPIGLSTGVMWSANLRTTRFCCEVRTAPGAEEEIRMVFEQVGRLMKSQCAHVFQDASLTSDGQWIFENSKV